MRNDGGTKIPYQDIGSLGLDFLGALDSPEDLLGTESSTGESLSVVVPVSSFDVFWDLESSDCNSSFVSAGSSGVRLGVYSMLNLYSASDGVLLASVESVDLLSSSGLLWIELLVLTR